MRRRKSDSAMLATLLGCFWVVSGVSAQVNWPAETGQSPIGPIPDQNIVPAGSHSHREDQPL